MYKTFFRLRENPFNTNPDPRFLYVTPQVREAREELRFGVQNRKGLILLTGEVGTGKTTLVNYLLDWLRQQQMPSAFIFNSHLSVNHLFDFILNDFGIPLDSRLKGNMLLLLNQWLMESFRSRRTPVLIVDEAQGLSLELLEEIRLLLNLETASEKLLQIVLVGQPELENTLKRPEMRQLRQRIALRCTTAPLTLEESRAYVAERLRIAGASGGPIFESDAVEALHFHSRGIPRVMNLLCEHSLINAFVEHLNPVPAPMVEEAARQCWMDEVRPGTQHPVLCNQNDSSFALPHSIVASATNQPAESSLSPADQFASGLATDASTPIEPESLQEDTSAPHLPQFSADINHPVNLDMSTPLNRFTPAPPVLEQRQTESGLVWDSASSRDDALADFIAELKRGLEARSPQPSPISPSGGKEISSVPNLSHKSNSKVFSLDSMNRLPNRPFRTKNLGFFPPLDAWAIPCKAVLANLAFPASWATTSAEVLPKLSKSIVTCQVTFRQWTREFRRDWAAMTHSIAASQANKALLNWLRQPLSSKPKNSTQQL